MVKRGDPRESIPGQNIVIPEHPAQIRAVDVDLEHVRQSYMKNALAQVNPSELTEVDLAFLAEETRWSRERLAQELEKTAMLMSANTRG